MPISLEYVILEHAEDAQLALLFHSDNVSAEDAGRFRQLVVIEPSRDDEGVGSPAVAVVPYDDDERALLAFVCEKSGSSGGSNYQFLLIPYEYMTTTHGTLEQVLARLPLEADEAGNAASLLTLADSDTGDSDIGDSVPGALFGDLLKSDFEIAMTILGALLHKRKLLIRGFPTDYGKRLDLIADLRLMMTAAAAASLTFATNQLESSQELPHLLFADESAATGQWIVDWRAPGAIAGVTNHPYIELLRSWWQGDTVDLVAKIRGMDVRADTPAQRCDIDEALAWAALRYALDKQVTGNDEIETGDMIRTLTGAAPPLGALRRAYVKKLLENALHDRDMLAGTRVAEELESDGQLEAELSGIFDEMLETQPDTVYVFIRNRLRNLGIDERWLQRLQQAARDSLQVAIEEGDVPTLISWLELIAHEPRAYELQEVLREGVLLSRERAHENGELGIHLILIATRRLPDIVDILYEDAELVAALPTKMSGALRENSAESLAPLIGEVAEYFLLALFHAIETSDAQVVTKASVEYLWSLFVSEQKINLPMVYRPPAMIRSLATLASHKLTEEALNLHLAQLIRSDDRDLFVQAATNLANRDVLFPRLRSLLEGDNFTPDQALSILNSVSGIDNVSPRDVIDTFFLLLNYYGWDPATQPMMEALARLMGKNQALHISYRHLWKQFESCNALQIENATRISINQLLRQLKEEEDLALVVEGVARICKQGNWSRNLITTLNAWWRNYTHQCRLTGLQRLEREMEAQRHLEPQKQILRTVLAMRRWMPDRDASAFANAINLASNLVEHITDAFDIAQLTDIDPHTVRRELEEFGGDLSADERHILANNLRSLAQIITQMAENRSKPSLIRSDDSIDLQLMRGEANPQGSIDMMKWIAGYLDGAHNQSDE